MIPLFESAHVCTFKNQKRYDSQRIGEIFKLVVQPSHNAFVTALAKPLCTPRDIQKATNAHNLAERQIDAERRIAERQADRMQTLERAARDLAGRYIMKNTNNSKVYLLPEGFEPDGQYTNTYGINNLKIPVVLKHLIASECNSIGLDQFVFEKVTRWNVANIIDQEEHNRA